MVGATGLESVYSDFSSSLLTINRFFSMRYDGGGHSSSYLFLQSLGKSRKKRASTLPTAGGFFICGNQKKIDRVSSSGIFSSGNHKRQAGDAAVVLHQRQRWRPCSSCKHRVTTVKREILYFLAVGKTVVDMKPL